MTQRRVPTSRLGRVARLARAGTRTGASLLLSRGTEGAAAQAAAVLGTMRGLAAKVGQMASYIDGLVPEQHREIYESALGTLRSAAATSSPAQIRSVVENEFGAPVSQLFECWDDQPIASASIGQVHRAVLHDGREVAVKVQHPGIDRAIDADLANADLLRGIVSTVAPRGVNTKAIFQEVAQRFREELDYELEARRQRFFSDFHAGDPTIVIPRVIGERTSRRVLTTELARGMTLEQAALAETSIRKIHVETLWRFVFKATLVAGQFNADPHPGNYLFHPDGRITFLDFGCVQELALERLADARQMHRAAISHDETAFARHTAGLLGTHGGSFERAIVGFTRACFEPLFRSPFHISQDYVRGLVTRIQNVKREVFAKDKSFAAPPPELALLNRLQFGFYSVVARMDVELDYAAIERAFLGSQRV